MGLLLYVAITKRPDIAFAVLRLARFLINPGPLHHKVTNRVINYLIGIKNLTLYFGGFNNLKVVSDALFEDNTLDRKSFWAFVVKFFGGLILWRANKQNPVTIFIMKAELLILL